MTQPDIWLVFLGDHFEGFLLRCFCLVIFKVVFNSDQENHKKDNQGDMGKIHVKRQFFEDSGPQGHFFEKTKFLGKVYGSMCTKFKVCIGFRLARRRATNTYIHKLIHKYTHTQIKLGISSTCCSAHVDF